MSDSIVARIEGLLRQRKNPDCLRIGIAGGSGSGKSTVAESIRKGLQPCTVEIVALDRFFKPVDQLPRYYSDYHQDHRPDFNRPDSLKHEDMLSFCRGFTGAGVVVFDGHFALYYPKMRRLMDIKCFVSLPTEEMLARRTSRNLAAGYGGDRATILNYNRECVLPSYEKFILPTMKHADIVVPNGSSDDSERDAIIDALCDRVRSQ